MVTFQKKSAAGSCASDAEADSSCHVERGHPAAINEHSRVHEGSSLPSLRAVVRPHEETRAASTHEDSDMHASPNSPSERAAPIGSMASSTTVSAPSGAPADEEMVSAPSGAPAKKSDAPVEKSGAPADNLDEIASKLAVAFADFEVDSD